MKEFCDSLGEEQLNEKVIVWREDEAISDLEPTKLEADHYIGKGEHGCYPLDEAGLTLKDAEEQGLKKVYDKGYPILMENF